MKMKYETIPLKDVFLEDERFRISFFPSLDRYKQEMRAVGMMCPPVVVKRRKKTVLVTGWKRVLAAKELSVSTIPVFISDEMDDLKTFHLTLYENLTEQGLSFLEKTEIISKLLGFGVDRKCLIKEYCPLLELPATPSHLETYQKMGRLEFKTKEFIHERNVSLPVVELLLQFPPQARERLIPVLDPMGQNKQKEILEDLLDLLLKEGPMVTDLLDRDQFKKILSDEKLSDLQKTERIRLAIRRLRYPALSDWNETLVRYMKKMNWPKEIPLTMSPFFEGDQFTFHIPFKDRKEAEMLLSELKRLVATQEFSEMMNKLTCV
jgi:ParB-like chromosome segregation protein Spo0J